MLENMVTSLLSYQQIKTTLQKAKAAKPLADHLITLGKNDTLASRRQAYQYLQNHDLTSKLFKEVAPRFKNRQGGYTRILQLNRRKGDGAQLALLELTEKEIKVKEPKKTKKKEAKHDHSHEGHEHPHKHEEKEQPRAGKDKKGDVKKEQKPGFFKNIGKFFRNKGGG
jgi:large subunit ribosomal protein L17